MTSANFFGRLGAAFRGIRPARLFAILVAALAAGLISDWLRQDRVVFPRPLPEFTTVPAER